jgi:C4-dicarboxylate-specific signal transduction histidine kinase
MAMKNETPDQTAPFRRTVACRYAARCGGACQQFDVAIFEPGKFTTMSCVLHHRRRDAIWFSIATAIVTLLTFWAVYTLAVQQQLADFKQLGDQRLEHSIARLNREIDKFGIIPLTIALDSNVPEFFNVGAGDQAAVQAMNQYLTRLNLAAGTLQTFLIDTNGQVISSSNWADKDSFIGRKIAYRPYFQNARPGKIYGYYAIGTTGDAAGYYLATELVKDGHRIGVVAVKIDLEQLGDDWAAGFERPMLMYDANNVVVLSSRKDWTYRSLGPISPDKMIELNSTQQYNRHIFASLDWQASAPMQDHSAFIKVTEGKQSRTYLADTRFLPNVSMTLSVLSDYTALTQQAGEQAATVAIVIVLGALFLYIAHQRRLVIQERLLARDALQEAYNHLERQFEHRSQQLRDANTELRHEVQERVQAAKRLENVQNELIRTENLAVIGQLSAGIVHEINQPLAALSTLSENSVRFLELNDTSTVRHNLQRICDLVRRMGMITGQLRSFARRTDGEAEVVDVQHSIETTLLLLSHRTHKENIAIVVKPAAQSVQVLVDPVRLEQVLVNLISNAMDALHGNGEARIDIGARLEGDKAIIDVADNGHGLSAPVLEKLFEPFFTTKKTSGLGLGLAISQDIIRRFGGELEAFNGSNGGAVFRITLNPVSQLQCALPREIEHA